MGLHVRSLPAPFHNLAKGSLDKNGAYQEPRDKWKYCIRQQWTKQHSIGHVRLDGLSIPQ